MISFEPFSHETSNGEQRQYGVLSSDGPVRNVAVGGILTEKQKVLLVQDGTESYAELLNGESLKDADIIMILYPDSNDAWDKVTDLVDHWQNHYMREMMFSQGALWFGYRKTPEGEWLIVVDGTGDHLIDHNSTAFYGGSMRSYLELDDDDTGENTLVTFLSNDEFMDGFRQINPELYTKAANSILDSGCHCEPNDTLV